MDNNLNELYNWAIANNAKLNLVDIKKGDFGYGFFAKEDIPINTSFAILPNELILTQSWASSTNIGKLIINEYKTNIDNYDEEEMYLISLFGVMIDGRFNSSNKFHIYLNSIPKEYTDLYWWNDNEIELLNGSHLYKAGKNKKTHYKKVFDKIFPNLIKNYPDIFISTNYTFSNFIWALSSYFSRGFPEKVFDDNSKYPTRGCLLPLLDLTNHKFNTPILWFHDNKTISFITKSIVKKDEEVFNNYGPKSNSEFLIGYGFTIENNLEDSFIIPINLSKKDPYYSTKEYFIKKYSILYIIRII